MTAALVSSYLFPRYQKVAYGDDVSPLAYEWLVFLKDLLYRHSVFLCLLIT
jgi:hypothetical protein